MPASYPTSVKTFTTKADGGTISASHINDLQLEVTAIENGLKAGLAHDLLFTDATYDIGKAGATRPRDFFLSRNAVIGGTLSVTGVATLTAIPVFSGGVVASQTALDFLYASSATAFGRVAAGTALQVPRINSAGTGWEFGEAGYDYCQLQVLG
jgi:hypothetical protein